MFYDRFVELCSRKGVAPTRAAIEAGISKSLVSKWKANGSKEPSPEVVRKLAEYFGISKFEVLEEIPDKQKETPAKTASVDDDDIKFALFGTTEIDDDTLEDIKAYARFKREQRKG